MITFFWCSNRFFTVVVFWDLIIKNFKTTSRWWPCWCRKRFCGLRKIKKLERFFLRCHKVSYQALKCCSHIKGANWIHFVLYFFVLVKMVALMVTGSLFAFASGLVWVFLDLHFYWILCNCVPEMIWQQFDWFWSSLCWNVLRFVVLLSVRTSVCEVAPLHFSFDDFQLSWSSVGG